MIVLAESIGVERAYILLVFCQRIIEYPIKSPSGALHPIWRQGERKECKEKHNHFYIPPGNVLSSNTLAGEGPNADSEEDTFCRFCFDFILFYFHRMEDAQNGYPAPSHCNPNSTIKHLESAN